MARFGSYFSDTAASIPDQLRVNAGPLVLIGVGIGWILLGARAAEASHGAVEAVKTASHDAAEAMKTVGAQAAAQASQAAESLRAGARGMADANFTGRLADATRATRESVVNAGANLRRIAEDHPLVAGILAMAVGATIAALLPATRAEDRVLGESADKIAKEAETLAGEVAERGARSVRAGAEAARDAFVGGTI